MKRELNIENIGKGTYKIVSMKMQRGRRMRADTYMIDLKSDYCSCKSWQFRKSCFHLKMLKAMLKEDIDCIIWNVKKL